MNSPMNIWALTDTRIGNSKQTLALAASLGDYTEKKVRFSRISKLPNTLLGASLVGVEINTDGKKPDVIISAGRKLARVSAALKKKYKCKAIHIMNPGSALLANFDHVIIPNHDDVENAKNVIRITGAVSSAKKHTETSATGLKQVAVLIGSITPDEATKLVKTLNENKLLYLITTSRRTPPEATEIIEKNIRQIHQLYKYGSKEKNPYDSFLKSADKIIVTGDSVNMATEAAHTGKPVYIMEVETKEKFKKFWQELYNLGIARKLNGKLESWEYKPLSNLKEIKKKISL